MALPDVNFTNNVGTLAFKRCMIDVADEWQWDGRSVVRRKRVTVDGRITRSHDESMAGVLTQVSGHPSKGQRGTLTLPWTVLKNIKIESFEMEMGGWEDMVRVQASFLDDIPANNLYTLHFFDLELNNPRLSAPIPAKRTFDYYTQMPMETPAGVSPEITPTNPFYGPIRFRTNYGMMSLMLSGAIMLPDGNLPDGLVDKLAKRIGVGEGGEGNTTDLPEGYPCVFNLGDAIPELTDDMAITSVFVTGGQIQWSVERQVARIQLRMLTQPQNWPGV